MRSRYVEEKDMKGEVKMRSSRGESIAKRDMVIKTKGYGEGTEKEKEEKIRSTR